MVDPLLRKALKDLRTQVLAWGVGVGLLLFLTVALYPSISASYGEVWEQLPEGMRAFFGLESSLVTFEGYMSAEFFSYAPLALGVFAILAGTASLAGEEGDGTLDLLLAQPIRRVRLILMKLLGLTVAIGALIAIIVAFFWAATPFLDVEFHKGRTLLAFALLWPFETAVAYLSVFLSLALPRRLLAGTLMAIVMVASYILDSLSNMVSWLAPFRPLFLTEYYQGTQALVYEVSWAYTLGLLGILALALVMNIVLLERRDIGVRPTSPLPWLGTIPHRRVRPLGQ